MLFFVLGGRNTHYLFFSLWSLPEGGDMEKQIGL